MKTTSWRFNLGGGGEMSGELVVVSSLFLTFMNYSFLYHLYYTDMF